MARKAMLGNKLRRLRRDRNIAQVELARRLGISASYLNLIEHNQRPLTLPLLLKLADHFEIDLQSFSQDSEARLVSELTELFGDPLFQDPSFQDGAPTREEINEVVELSPAVSRAMVGLYRAYRGARDDLQDLTERLSEDSFLSTSTHELRTLLTSIRSFSEILRDHQDMKAEERRRFSGILADESARLSDVVDQMLAFATDEANGAGARQAQPAEEVGDRIQAADNHFPELEEAAERLRRDAGLEATASAEQVAGTLAERVGLEVRLRPDALLAGSGMPRARAETPDRMLFSASEPPPSRRFRILREVAERACTALLDDASEAAPPSGEAAAALWRRTRAGYLAGALLMPYERFLEAAKALRYDIDRLRHGFEVSFEQVCHRLTSLQRIGAKGVPFHFLRIDIAGNLSKRFSASGLRIARYGGACPLWPIHAAFLAPGRIHRQVSRLPDGSTYFDIARTIEKADGAGGRPGRLFAVGLGCELSHARDLAYSDGLDLEAESAVVPVGITCRLCERSDCQQRAFAPILPSLHGEPTAAGC